MAQLPELIQFAYSHFNEKARWALDFKGLAHQRTSLLPGPHAPRVKKLTGRTETPVLRLDGKVIAGSAAIIAALEDFQPSPPLLPQNSEQCRQALALQAQFDTVLGPMTRRLVFDALLPHPGYLTDMFAGHVGMVKRTAYRASLPMVQGLMKKSMGITDQDSIAEAQRETATALDLIVRQSAQSGYLAGEAFSVADLTAAALLAPIADPNFASMRKPSPMPASLQALVDSYRDHPGMQWVHHIYAQHRGQSFEVKAQAAA